MIHPIPFSVKKKNLRIIAPITALSRAVLALDPLTQLLAITSSLKKTSHSNLARAVPLPLDFLTQASSCGIDILTLYPGTR